MGLRHRLRLRHLGTGDAVEAGVFGRADAATRVGEAMSLDAMKLALDALEEIADEVFSPYDNKLGDAILALRAAIEQAQEPVAWMYTCEGDTGLPVLVHTQKDWAKASWWKEIPLYTAPRQWQGLTDEEREQFRQWAHPDIIEAIELKLQERNT